MSRRPARLRTSWTQAALTRALPLLAIAIAATYAIRDSAAQVTVIADPALAHSIAPWDGRVTAALALASMQTAGVASSKVAPTALALEALRQDPTAIQAYNVLAADAQLHGNTARTRDLFRYSLSLSRRELASRLWAIEEAVSRGDVRGALYNYDFALKTSRDATDLLYPILLKALSEPRIRNELLPILGKRPNWGADFIDYVSRVPANPQGSAAFLPMVERAGLPVTKLQHARVVDALLNIGLNAQAWDYYARYHPGVNRRLSRDAEFRAGPDAQTLFDWQTFNEGGLSASIGRRKGGAGELAYSIAAASSGKLARQFQLLPPGRYKLSGRARTADVPGQERPYLAVICNLGRELIQVPLPVGKESAFSASFTVTSDCPTQYLELMARQTDNPSGLEGAVQYAAITPAD